MDRIVTATVPYLPHARSRFHFLLSSGSIYSLTTVCTIDHPRLCLACSALSSLSWRVLQPSLKVSSWAASRTVTPANLVETLVQHGRIVRISLTGCNLSRLTHRVNRTDFQVKDALPNVSFPLGRNWAGNIPVGRPNQPNDTLFFWGFEKENGSFTANSTEPWGIWLNGGCVIIDSHDVE